MFLKVSSASSQWLHWMGTSNGLIFDTVVLQNILVGLDLEFSSHHNVSVEKMDVGPINNLYVYVSLIIIDDKLSQDKAVSLS